MVVCITLLFALLGFTSFGDTSCEAYKTQVINDCDSCLNTLAGIEDELSYTISEAGRGLYVANGTSNSVYVTYFNSIIGYANQSMGRVDALENSILSIRQTASSLQCNSSSDCSCDCAEVLGDISAQLSTISDNLIAQGAKVDTVTTRLNSILSILTTINGKLANVDKNVLDISTVSADIKDYIQSQTDILQSILGDNYDKGVQGILANAEATTEWLDDIYGLLQLFEEPITETASQLYQICDYFDTYLQQAFPLWLELLQKLDPDKVSTAVDNLSNNLGLGNYLDLFTNQYFSTWLKLTSTKLNRPITGVGSINGQYVQALFNPSTSKYGFVFGNLWPQRPFIPSFENMLLLYADTIPRALGSISTIEYLRYLNENTNNVSVILRDFTNQVAVGFSSITNTLVEGFSIFSNDSPLKGTTEKPDKYYDYLTNYYIKVSVNPSGSASEPYTNWFNRIEMLLAALVFRTDKAVSNDFTTANTDSMRGALDSALDNVRGIQDNSQSVITTVEKSSRSLLNVMSQWDDKLTMAASLPSHIEFIDIGGAKDGGGAKRSSSEPGPGGAVNTKIGLDLSSGPLKLFVDSCRAVSTLCWIFVFIFAGWGVACFMVSKFLTVIKFCYAVFKVALGLG